MIVIALTGLKGSGKDSVADVLVKDHGFVKMSFAAPIKRLVRNLDPIAGYDVYQDCGCGDEGCGAQVEPHTVGDLYDDYGYDDETVKESPWGDEVRRLWQRFGTEVMRKEDPDFWVNLAEKDLLGSGHERVVFTDCRFPNEAEMIYALNGPFFGDGELMFSPITASVWQVTRPDLVPDGDGHESEQHSGLLEEEINIINAGTLADLHEPVAIGLHYVLNEGMPQQSLLEQEINNMIEAARG